ncbi:signal peptidase I [Candidatus Heimdallarchaeota archaeon B3_Heim]|nr:MAG: signal peptidase I [Candidatus Heimdallarchaeota archaeon B3_Heim]
MPLDRKYKSIIESGILLGSAILLAIFIALSLTNYLGNSSMPNVAVSTTSMMPIYRGFQDGTESDGTLYPFRGDILLVRKVPADTLEVGDVIVFNTPAVSDPVVHRIVARWRNVSDYIFFKTNGDNNKPPDIWIIGEDDVIGLVVIRIPHIGWFLLAMQTNLGKILILTLAGLVLFGEEIFNSLGLSKNKKEREKITTDTNNQEIGNNDTKMQSKSISSIIRKKESTYVLLGLAILIMFTTSNVLASVSHSPSIDIFGINDSTESNSLLDSSLNSLITLNNPSKWTGLYQRDVSSYFEVPYFNKSDTPQRGYLYPIFIDFPQKVSFYPISIKLRSGGIFNNIDYFEIRVNQTKGLYRWTIVNNYIGIHTIKGGIISQINGTVEISIYLYTRGLFASSPLIYTFPIFLQG